MEKKNYTPSTVLMCPPTYYWIEEEINTRMNKKIQPIMEKAWRQWTVIRNLYTKFGLLVYEIEPYPGLTEMIFTANGAWGVYNEKEKRSEIVLSNFVHKRRRGEKEHYRKWLKERFGFAVFEIREDPQNPELDILFEGQGDATLATYAYFIGYGYRTNEQAVEHVKRLLCLEKPTIPLKLCDSNFYHLDTCMMSLPEKNALIFYGGAFKAGLQKINEYIKKHDAKHYRMEKNLADCLAANSVYINDIILLNVPFPDYSEEAFEKSARGEFLDWNDVRLEEIIKKEAGYSDLIKFLWELEYKIIPVYTSEYIKSGAGIRCMTLFLHTSN
ncbi:MAG: hypothetical protein HY445_03630 [Candidatus Niyogibacteria bacterium]|nr:hypothetical protein [Candidatus Niyogibacteria bacterium]